MFSCWSGSEGVHWPAGEFMVALCLVQLLVRFKRGTSASRRIHGGPMPCSVAGHVQKGYIGQLANSWWPYAFAQLLVMFRRGKSASRKIRGGPMPCSVASQVQKGYIGQPADSWWPFAAGHSLQMQSLVESNHPYRMLSVTCGAPVVVDGV